MALNVTKECTNTTSNSANEAKDETKEEEKDDSKDETKDETLQEIRQKDKVKNCFHILMNIYFTYEFLILVMIVILLARAYPPLGAIYLAPRITASWIAVIFIFLLAGLSLKTEELKKAFQNFYFNSFVQIYNFFVVSAIVFGFSRFMAFCGILSQTLEDGMVICSCLPMTINMVLVLTKSAGGDEASAIFNAAFGNMIVVFLSPVLILGYIGITGEVNILSVFIKLVIRVVLPVCIGQILQKIKVVSEFVKSKKKYFKKAQMYALVFIIYTTFCKTFSNESESNIIDILLMILFQFVLLCTVMILAWFLLKLFFRNEPKLRVMGLFGCTHKTVAMGVPLINAIFDDNPNLGLYTLPLLIWHPLQLVIGSFLVPRLNRFVNSEKERLEKNMEKNEEENGLPEL